MRKALATASGKAPPASARSRTPAQMLQDAKLQKLKPHLQRGMPIKGSVVVMVNGKATSVPVSFSHEHETRFESDDGIYFVSTTVNASGTVTYDVRLLEKESDPSVGTKIKQRLKLLAVPWGEVLLHVNGGGTLAFVSDVPEPTVP